MILTLVVIVVGLTTYFFIRDVGNHQIISSRFVSFYKPFKAETIVQHEYTSKPEIIWQALLRFEDYPLWFPGINRMLPVVDSPRYVHGFSFDRFSIEPGAFIRIRPKSFLPLFKGRILKMEPNKRLEMEMRFNPLNKEQVSFEIILSPSGTSEVVCQRTSRGLFSFLTIWRFADKGSSILHNLSYFLLDNQKEKTAVVSVSEQITAPHLSRETIIAQSVQAGLDGNMDLINGLPDKPTRGMAKAALVKAKKSGKIPVNLAKALNAAPLSTAASPAEIAPLNSNPESDEEMVNRLVAAGLQGNMDEINALENKALRGKIKAAIVRSKRNN